MQSCLRTLFNPPPPIPQSAMISKGLEGLNWGPINSRERNQSPPDSSLLEFSFFLYIHFFRHFQGFFFWSFFHQIIIEIVRVRNYARLARCFDATDEKFYKKKTKLRNWGLSASWGAQSPPSPHETSTFFHSTADTMVPRGSRARLALNSGGIFQDEKSCLLQSCYGAANSSKFHSPDFLRSGKMPNQK